MVSLNARDSQYRQGGFFLETQTDESHTSGRESLGESLSADHRFLTADIPEHGFWPLPSSWIAGCEIVILLGYFVSLLVCTFSSKGKLNWPDRGDPDPPFAFFVLLHGVLWVIVALCDRAIQVFHQKVRKRGYLDFYRRNRFLRRMPFIVFSAGNAILLVFTQFMGCPRASDESPSEWEGMKRTHVLTVIVCAESIIVLPSLFYYLVRVCHFNSQRAAPDIHNDLQPLLGSGWNNGTEGRESVGKKELGLREGDFLDDTLEKQADMIRYLQQHNSNLARHINQLTSRGLR